MSSFGEELRRERELRRITLREVADATKINLRYLEALDKNDFKHLPGGVFNRGFVRAYAQFIGIDPDQMVSAYLMEEQAQSKTSVADSEETLMRGTRHRGPRETKPEAPVRSGVMLKAGLGLLLAALLIAAGAFVYFKWFSGPTAEQTGAADLPEHRPAAARSAAIEPARSVTKPEAAQADAAGTGDTQDPRVVAEPEAKAAATNTAATKERTSLTPATAVVTPPPAENVTAPAASVPSASAGPVLATIYIDRATTGRLNCDNRQIDLLNGMPAGTRFELSCKAFLIVDADDGGALRIGWPGVPAAAPGAAGQPIAGHRILVPRRPDGLGTEEGP